MSTSINRYNPIAPSGSSRYSPISTVSTVPDGTPVAGGYPLKVQMAPEYVTDAQTKQAGLTTQDQQLLNKNSMAPSQAEVLQNRLNNPIPKPVINPDLKISSSPQTLTDKLQNNPIYKYIIGPAGNALGGVTEQEKSQNQAYQDTIDRLTAKQNQGIKLNATENEALNYSLKNRDAYTMKVAQNVAVNVDTQVVAGMLFDGMINVGNSVGANTALRPLSATSSKLIDLHAPRLDDQIVTLQQQVQNLNTHLDSPATPIADRGIIQLEKNKLEVKIQGYQRLQKLLNEAKKTKLINPQLETEMINSYQKYLDSLPKEVGTTPETAQQPTTPGPINTTEPNVPVVQPKIEEPTPNNPSIFGKPIMNNEAIPSVNPVVPSQDVPPMIPQTAKPVTTNASNENTIIQGPGYKQFSDRLDMMVKDKTLHPEDAEIAKTVFANTNDAWLGTLDPRSNPYIKRSGNSHYSDRSMTVRKGATLLGKTNDWWNNPRVEPVIVLFHEYGHLADNLILNADEHLIVRQVYQALGKKQIKNIFAGGLGETTEGGTYFAKNEKEFLVQSLAEYIMENKVPAEKMRPLLEKLALRFWQALKNLINRGRPALLERLTPIFEKMLAGDKNKALSDFMAGQPPNFKNELKAMVDSFKKPEGIFVNPNKPPVTLPPPKFTPDTTSVSPIDLSAKIQEAAQANLPPEIPVEPLNKVLQGDEKTPIDEQVNALDYFRTPWKVFEKMKMRPQYEEILKGYEAYLSELPRNIKKITAWSKQVPAASNERIFKFLDGEKIALDQTEAKVAWEIKTWLSEWADRLGMKPDARISEYITHIFPAGKGGEIPEEIAFLINKKIPGSVYDPFLLPRQGALGYIQDTWGALDAYVKRATRKVNMDPGLANLKKITDKPMHVSQLNYLNRWVGAVNLRPTELDTAVDTFIKQNLGYMFGTRPTATITRNTRMMISGAKIGGSMISFAKNLTQGVNTFKELGTQYTIRGYKDLVIYGGKELRDNNALLGSLTEDRNPSYAKKFREKFGDVLFLNMTSSEYVNRGAAYYGAKAKFLDGKITPKEYREAFGKPMPSGYTPTISDAVQYGKFVSGKTQFLFDPLNTPVILNSDIAKTAGQFSTFGLKQAEFIIDAAAQKEWWKLLRYLASSMLLFSTIGSAFGMKWSDSFQPFRFGAPPAWSFFWGLWDAAVGTKDKYGNVPTNAARIRSAENTLFTNMVPGGSQLQKSYEGIKAVNQGASRGAPTKANPQGAYQYSIPQTPMNYIRAGLFGKSYTDQGQQYYNKSTPQSSGTSSSRYNPI